MVDEMLGETVADDDYSLLINVENQRDPLYNPSSSHAHNNKKCTSDDVAVATKIPRKQFMLTRGHFLLFVLGLLLINNLRGHFKLSQILSQQAHNFDPQSTPIATFFSEAAKATPNKTLSMEPKLSPKETFANEPASPSNKDFSSESASPSNETFSFVAAQSLQNETFPSEPKLLQNETFSLDPRSITNKAFALEAAAAANETVSLEKATKPPFVYQCSAMRSNNDDGSGVPKVLMVTYIFGATSVRKKYLRMFVESARWSGIDILLLGDHPVPFPLPDNVRHCLVSWDYLVYRIQESVLDGVQPKHLYQSKNYYKVIDFKPLFATLFPELVDGYDWWGHLDNDMILGNVRQFLTPELLNKYDIFSGLMNEFTWGPFMLYRNTPLINELFRQVERPLADIFDTPVIQGFDEWGGQLNRTHFKSTMSGIVKHKRKRLGIRWTGGIQLVWDGDCLEPTENVRGCCTCHYHFPNASSTTNTTTTTTARQERHKQTLMYMGECADGAGRRRGRLYPALVCHFEFTKQAMEQSLVNETFISSLMAHGHMGINFKSGFHPEYSTG